MTGRLHLVAMALAASGCLTKLGRQEATENAKFTFPHAVHVEAGLSCATCHAAIAEATEIGPTVHVSLPLGAAQKPCLSCHDKAPAVPPPRRIDRSISFSHARHLPKANGQCARCHTELVEAGAAKAPVPPMSACTACHNHAVDYAQARCQPCHVDLKRYRLKPVSDFQHAADFLRVHGAMARSDAATCAACHEQTSCAECHGATTRPLKPDLQWPEKVEATFIHRGDYVSRHTIEASADPASCRRCHGSAFCQACHREQGVLPLTGGRDPHPAGWASGSAHGIAARQDILSCAGCHDQGARSTCVSCHKFVDPHPAGWAQRHNKTTDVASNSMCRTCHAQ